VVDSLIAALLELRDSAAAQRILDNLGREQERRIRTRDRAIVVAAGATVRFAGATVRFAGAGAGKDVLEV
jgi:hypothetical protein